MSDEKPKCYMKAKGEKCIRASAPVPGDISCDKCIWYLEKIEGDRLKSVERLYALYKKKE